MSAPLLDVFLSNSHSPSFFGISIQQINLFYLTLYAQIYQNQLEFQIRSIQKN